MLTIFLEAEMLKFYFSNADFLIFQIYNVYLLVEN
jgi:hypothetical protein